MLRANTLLLDRLSRNNSVSWPLLLGCAPNSFSFRQGWKYCLGQYGTYENVLLLLLLLLLFNPLEFFTSVLADGFSLEFE